MSWARIDASVRRIEQFGRRLDGFAPGADTEWAIDLALMKALAGRWVRDLRDLDLAHRSPDLYLGEALFGPYMLLMKDFAPLPQRAADLAGRLGDVPGVLAAAQANLRDVPGVWVQIAHNRWAARWACSRSHSRRRRATGGHPPAAGRPGAHHQPGDHRAARLCPFSRNPCARGADSAFAVGTDIWNAKVREEQMLDLDADQIEAIGRGLIADTERALAAERVAWTPAVPTPGATCWRGAAAASRPAPACSTPTGTQWRPLAIVIARDLVTLPPGESLEIRDARPDPPAVPVRGLHAARPVRAAAAGRVLRDARGAGAGPTGRRDAAAGPSLRQDPDHGGPRGLPRPPCAVGVGQPGRNLPRRLGSTLSNLFIEGWAFYCEEMMEQEGFLTDPAGA